MEAIELDEVLLGETEAVELELLRPKYFNNFQICQYKRIVKKNSKFKIRVFPQPSNPNFSFKNN